MPAVTDVSADNLLIRLLLTPEGRQDPYPLYRELREVAPVLRSSLGFIVLSRYDDCITALRDPRLGRGTELRTSGEGGPMALGMLDTNPERRQQFFERVGHNMLFADPPEHTRLRRLVSRAFTPSRIDGLRPAIAEMVDDILDDVADAGAVDVMQILAFPLPVRVIGELVGVPADDRASFQPLVRAAAAALEPVADPATLDGAVAALDQTRDYFVDLIAERRKRPASDLLSGLIAAREAGDALDDDEIVATAILLFAAGFETTTNLIGNGLLALLQAPDEMRRWRNDPSLDSTGTDELLRWDSPVQVNMRTALTDTTIAGEALHRGDVTIVLQGGGNHDPAKFPDPDVLDVGRDQGQPLSFGWGIHHCLGAGLARLEGQVLFRRLLDRFTDIELRSEPEWRPNLTLRGLTQLHVEVRP